MVRGKMAFRTQRGAGSERLLFALIPVPVHTNGAAAQ
jgi:hypothetical protein